MKLDCQIMAGFSIMFAMIAALFSPRMWIAVVAGLVSGLGVGPWCMWQAGAEFTPDSKFIFAMVIQSLFVSFLAILAALAVYLLKRVIEALWRRVTNKEPASQFDNEPP
jgi:hypothetical protein